MRVFANIVAFVLLLIVAFPLFIAAIYSYRDPLPQIISIGIAITIIMLLYLSYDLTIGKAIDRRMKR